MRRVDPAMIWSADDTNAVVYNLATCRIETRTMGASAWPHFDPKQATSRADDPEWEMFSITATQDNVLALCVWLEWYGDHKSASRLRALFPEYFYDQATPLHWLMRFIAWHA